MRSLAPILHHDRATRVIIAACLAIGIACGIDPARCEINVQGTREHVVLTVQDAPLSEVLAQLRDVFAFSYQSSAPLDRPISGRYAGRLESVIGRLLEKNDYITRHVDNRFSITVYGSKKPMLNGGASAEFMPPPFPPALPPPPPIARAPTRRMLANPAGVTDGGLAR